MGKLRHSRSQTWGQLCVTLCPAAGRCRLGSGPATSPGVARISVELGAQRWGAAPGRSPTGSPAADGPWPGGDRVSVRHEGSEGTTRGDPTGASPCGRDSGRDAGVRAELAACGCCGQAGRAGRSVAPGLCPDVPHAGTGSGRWTGWDVRGGAGGGLARPQERDSGAAAAPALQDPCHGGFTTGSCHMGTAPAGRAGWQWGGVVVAAGLRHGPADPALAPAGWCSLTHPGAPACRAEPSLPLPSHGRRCSGDGLCPKPWAGPRCPLSRPLCCTLTHLAAPAVPLGASVPGLRREGVLGSQRGAGAAGRRAGGGGAGQDHVIGTFGLRGRHGGL